MKFGHWTILLGAFIARGSLGVGASFARDKRIAPLGADRLSQLETNLIAEAWDVEKGLPQNTVEAIGQSPDGYLWLGTQSGFIRFDGVRFTPFPDPQQTGYRAFPIRSLIAARDGSIWGAGYQGVSRLKDGVIRYYSIESGLPATDVNRLYEDAAGVIWAGTKEGVARFDGNRFITETINPGRPKQSYDAICQTHDGALWFGGLELTRMKDGKVLHYGVEDRLKGEEIHALYEDRAGVLWIGAGANEIYHLKDGRIEPLISNQSPTLWRIMVFLEDDDGRMWMATIDGLKYFDGNRIVDFREKSGLFSHQIRCIYRDREAHLWFGSSLNGLLRLGKPRLSVYGAPEGLPSDSLQCVLDSRDGSRWIGSWGKGLFRLKDGALTIWRMTDGLPDDTVHALCETRDGALWIGTGKGAVRFKGGRFKVYTTSEGLPNNRVGSIVEDDRGDIWLGTERGLCVFRNEKFDDSINRESLNRPTISGIFKGRNGVLWIAAYRNGVYRILNGEVRRYTTKEGLSINDALGVFEDKQGNVWVALRNGDLNRIDGEKITAYRREQGLIGLELSSILEDDLNNLWLTSSNGVFRIAKSQFDELDRGRIKRLNLTTFGVPDGMRTINCLSFSQPNVLKTREGKLLIVTGKGLVTIDPQTVQTPREAPPVYLEEILANNQPVFAGERLTLGPGVNTLEIHYTGLNLTWAPRIRFRYKLEGLDKDWNEVGTRRTAYYSSLPPGDFRFQVMAEGESGTWGALGAEVRLTIKPKFYRTWWFYGLCLLLTSFLLLIIHKVRVIRANEAYLKEIAMLLPTAMMVVEEDGRVRMANHKYVESFGYETDETPTIQAWGELAYPDPAYRERNKVFLERASTEGLKTGGSTDFEEKRITCKDGTLREVEMRIARLREQMIITWSDVTARKQAEEALRHSENQLRRLAAQLDAIREAERTKISYEIHEELGQTLSGLMFDLKSHLKKLPPERKDLSERVTSMLELLNETIQSMRKLATDFRPTALDHLGLAAAMKAYAEEFQKRAGIACTIIEKSSLLAISRDGATALFRIFQDALADVEQRGAATRIEVRLTEENFEIHLLIEDDAKSPHTGEFPETDTVNRFGIQERAQRLGGRISRSLGPGNSLLIILPISHEDHAAPPNQRSIQVQ